MNITLKNILKFLSKNLGYFFINLAIILILLTFFTNEIINVDKSKIKETLTTNLNLTQEQDSQELESLTSYLSNLKNYILISIILSVVLFLSGFIFIYFVFNNLLEALFKISIHISIQSFLAALYYKLIPIILASNSFFKYAQNLIQNIPQDYLNLIINLITNLVSNAISKTVALALIIGIIFLLVSIIIYIIKKKKSK